MFFCAKSLLSEGKFIKFMPIFFIFADMIVRFSLLVIIITNFLVSCAGNEGHHIVSSCKYAQWFDISEDGKSVVLLSPYGSRRDTINITEPFDNIICMSSSQVAALSAIDADSVITAVSGIGYVTNPSIRSRYLNSELYDIGYETTLDYERILALDTDLLVTYNVSGTEPQFINKLRSLGVPVAVLYDHLEDHPLARAEYVRLFGALTGRIDKADSVFDSVCKRYVSLAAGVDRSSEKSRILLNIPYSDAWYVPGGDSYMSRLISDAGGEVLGAETCKRESKVISLEQAYRLSSRADLWLNPGMCMSLSELENIHQLFPSFGPLKKALPIYNNTLRITPEGGNDFWESGSVRPDLILEDIINMIQGKDSLYYFLRLE